MAGNCITPMKVLVASWTKSHDPASGAFGSKLRGASLLLSLLGGFRVSNRDVNNS